MLESHDGLIEQFEDLTQQHESYQLGMWMFLASEVMIFGALFTSFAVYRHADSHAFDVASKHMNLLYGSVNTAVLLASSFTMAMAIQRLQLDRPRAALGFLGVTLLLGVAFLGIKAAEYWDHVQHHLVPGRMWSYDGPDSPRARMFFFLYYFMTGVHALHVAIGVTVVAIMMLCIHLGVVSRRNYKPLELAGLYWHFVDIVWIFLFPVFYLPGMHAR